MKLHVFSAVAALVLPATAQTPKIFSGLLSAEVPVRGQIGMVVPPQEIDKFMAKVETAARKNPEWFKKHSENAKPGIPLPYDPQLGLTKEEYEEYLKLWEKRDFKAVQDVVVMLRKSSGGDWTFTATGDAAVLTTLRFDPASGNFRSPNGEMKRLEDIKADETSVLGAWTGSEWKFEEETGIGKTKENLAIGKFADNKFGVIVYRAQEVSSSGARLLDKSLVIRFPLGKAGIYKAPARRATAPKQTR